jgi:hypothetical protein
MSIEVELVRDYMSGEEVPAGRLPIARSMLADAVAAETGTDDPSVVAVGSRPGRTRSRRLARWSVGVAAAVAASAVLILQVVPAAKAPTSVAAAAEIFRLADSVQPAPPLQAGQWSDYRMHGVLLARVGGVGKTPTPDAKASIPIALEVWSNSTDATCTSQQFGTASFASPVNARAWGAIGLIDTPANQPVTGCAGGVETANGAESALAAIDVSTLTHNPATLAAELQAGSTGITAVDRAATGEPTHLAGFVRLTDLLVGPISGGWSGLGQEMLRTMARLPGVIPLGRTTAHSGQTGLSFSTSPQVVENPRTGAVVARYSEPTVVLDPGTGALLEARNFDIPVLQAAAQDFVGSPSAPVYTEGVSYGVTAEWVDPVAPPGVVGRASLPAWISTFHIIEAVTKPTTTNQEVSDLVNPLFGNGDFGAADDDTPNPGVTTYDFNIRGSSAEEDSDVAALTASGLFATVVVTM